MIFLKRILSSTLFKKHQCKSKVVSIEADFATEPPNIKYRPRKINFNDYKEIF